MQICIIFSFVQIRQFIKKYFLINYKNNAKMHTKALKIYDIISLQKAIIPKIS